MDVRVKLVGAVQYFEARQRRFLKNLKSNTKTRGQAPEFYKRWPGQSENDLAGLRQWMDALLLRINAGANEATFFIPMECDNVDEKISARMKAAFFNNGTPVHIFTDEEVESLHG